MSRVLFLSCILSMTGLNALADCPKICECKWRDGREVVFCHNAHYIDIPRGLDPSTQVLDLRHNNLRILPRDSFVYAGLTNLQRISLSFCNLIRIEGGAFKSVVNVKELDLSHNYLRYVPTTAINDMKGLREFRVAYNTITFLSSDAFKQNLELVKLDISHNNITAIEVGALRNLIYLEILDISENKIQALMVNEVLPLTRLRIFSIDSNPWHCDCRLKQLRMWLNNFGLTPSPPPTCSQPRWLFKQTWHLLNIDEFICVPQVSVMAPRVLASERENVTLVCNVKSESDVTITWLIGDSPIRKSDDSSRYFVYETVRPEYSFMSNFTLTGVIPDDQGTYTCVAENKAGYSEVNITLHVFHEVAEVRAANVEPTAHVKSNLLMGISSVIFFSLLLSSFIYCKLRSAQSSEHDENHQHPPKTSDLTENCCGDLSGNNVDPKNDLENTAERNQSQHRYWLTTRDVRNFSSISAAPTEGKETKVVNHIQRYSLRERESLDESDETNPSKTTVQNYLQSEHNALKEKDLISPVQCSRGLSQEPMKTARHNLDLLNLQCLPQQQINFPESVTSGQMLKMTYCTLPRTIGNSKNTPQVLSTLIESDEQNASLSRPMQSRSQDSTYRSSLALNAALSEVASSALTPGRKLEGDHLAISKKSSFAKYRIPQTEKNHLTFHRISNVGTREARCNEVTGGQDAYQFEYHTEQLEKFLQEYRSLQQQLLMMKYSYQTYLNNEFVSSSDVRPKTHCSAYSPETQLPSKKSQNPQQ